MQTKWEILSTIDGSTFQDVQLRCVASSPYKKRRRVLLLHKLPQQHPLHPRALPASAGCSQAIQIKSRNIPPFLHQRPRTWPLPALGRPCKTDRLGVSRKVAKISEGVWGHMRKAIACLLGFFHGMYLGEGVRAAQGMRETQEGQGGNEAGALGVCTHHRITPSSQPA